MWQPVQSLLRLALAAWTSIYQVKLPAKILFLHVEPSFFLSSEGSSIHPFPRIPARSTAVLAPDFRFAERGEVLDDLPGFHAPGLRDTQRGRVHLVLELLDDKVFTIHGAARLEREVEDAVAQAVGHHAADDFGL